MNKRLSNYWLLAVCVLLIGSSLWLTGCAPQLAIARSPLPTPQLAIAGSPLPTPSGVSPFLITPLPGEKARVGEVTEVVATPGPSRYSIRNEYNQKSIRMLFVRDSKNNQEIRLGSDNGSASFGAMTDQYLIWRYDCHTCDEKIDLRTGLYAHVLTTGQEISIAGPEGYQWYPKIDGQWVIYLDVSASKAYFAQLRAHNLTTGEDFLVGKEVPFNRPGEYYAISGNRIAWISGDVSGADAKWLFRTYDLDKHTARILNVPDTIMPSDLSFAGDVMVWWDNLWRGYDLKQEAVFTVPIIPTGWENAPVEYVIPVTVRDDQLFWSLKINGRLYHLTAPIIRDK